ncbi:hypothetical protein IQO03_06085 [Elizabethkingia anophelis]|nr:hypothetical protein [Elizabethkingia anophelis]BBQ08823.1 hypothetical protein JUNP353_3394 [Elizabethkingia anophelis]
MRGLIIFSVFFVSLMNAQKSRFDSVVVKLSTDSVSYKQFLNMGKINCIKKTGFDLESEYIAKYNLRFPFPRLISLEALKSVYSYYEKKKKKNCECLYVDNKVLKRKYINLVKNSKNYNKEPEYDINNYMKDYLEKYFIQVETK